VAHGSAGAHLNREARSGAIGHVAASESTSLGGEVRSRGARDSAEAHLSREARSEAIGHVVASELMSARR
jgi:transposase InsO family protein